MQGHTPYGQWHAFRHGRLIVLASAEDPVAARTAQAVTAVLAEHLPETRALASRAPETRDVVSLLASRQLDVAVLAAPEARAAAEGANPHGVGPVPLRAIAGFSGHVLVCHEEVPAAAVHDIVETLAERWRVTDTAPSHRPARPDADGPAPVPLHPAALDYWERRALPTPLR